MSANRWRKKAFPSQRSPWIGKSDSAPAAFSVFCNLKWSGARAQRAQRAACIVPCLVSQTINSKQPTSGDLPFPKRPSFPLTCIEFLQARHHHHHGPTDGREQFRRDFTPHKVTSHEKRDREPSCPTCTRAVTSSI